MFKKILAGLFIISFLAISTPAHATTLSDILNQLKSLKTEITTLSTRLTASAIGSVSDSATIDPIKLPPAPADCQQTKPGLEKVTLDLNNPGNQTVTQGNTNIELARVSIQNVGSEDICYLNGLQIGSKDNVI